MKSVLLIVCLCWFSTECVFAFLPYEEGEKETWERSMREGFDKLKSKSATEQITYLSDLLSALNGTYRAVETRAIYEEAKELLITIPGHATYYQNKIEAMRAEVLVNSKKSEAEISKMQDNGMEVANEWNYSDYCEAIAFPALSHMPSPETVAVLGHFLNDPEGRDGKNITGRNIELEGGPGRLNVNAEAAAIAIRKLGIEHPPFPIYDDHGMRVVREGEIDAWKSWWNDVKAGRRTYRFKGSNVEYGADGPASRQVIERAALNRKRDEERSTGKSHASPGSGPEAPTRTPAKPTSIAAILAACALLAVALWYFLRNRKPA